jgi:hypothetical protein
MDARLSRSAPARIATQSSAEGLKRGTVTLEELTGEMNPLFLPLDEFRQEVWAVADALAARREQSANCIDQ